MKIRILFFMIIVSCSAQAMENNIKIYYASSELGDSMCVKRSIQAGVIAYDGYRSAIGDKKSLKNPEEIWHNLNTENNNLNKVCASEFGNS